MNRLFKHFSNRKSQLAALVLSLLLVMAAVSMTGCDNTDSFEAKLEDARMALDDGNYALARSILETLPRTQEVLEYMSNAIAGGDLNLDTLNIIATMDELNTQGNQGSIDMIGLIIGDENNQLACDEIAGKIQSATDAIQLFKDIATMMGVTVQDLSDNQKTQLGLLSITRTVLTLAHLICNETGGTVTMTEAWIQANRSGFLPVTPAAEDLDRIGEDLTFVGYAIDVFADTNDLKDDFQGFMNDLDGNGDGQITADELNAYLTAI